MTWFSRAAPSAADPRGGAATPARERGGAGRTKRALEGEQPGESGRRNATAVRARRPSKGVGSTTREACKGEGEGGARTQLVRGAK